MEDTQVRTFGSEYCICEEIGRGGYAHVFSCIQRISGVTRAVKITSMDGSVEYAHNEIKILSKLKSKYFPRLFDVFEQDGKIYAVMELCKGISLHTYLVKNAPLQEKCTLIIGRQIFEALSYLHSNGIAHLDIKPENIIIDPNTLSIKLIDFGFSSSDVKQCKVFNGSLHYAAPELFIKKPYNAHKADIWSTGIILFTMVSGSLPFLFSEHGEHIRSIFKGNRRPLPDCTGDICRELIEKTIVINPELRLTTDEALKILDSVRPPRCLKALSRIVFPLASKVIYPQHRQRSHVAIIKPSILY